MLLAKLILKIIFATAVIYILVIVQGRDFILKKNNQAFISQENIL